jgi:hypothetical protein
MAFCHASAYAQGLWLWFYVALMGEYIRVLLNQAMYDGIRMS